MNVIKRAARKAPEGFVFVQHDSLAYTHLIREEDADVKGFSSFSICGVRPAGAWARRHKSIPQRTGVCAKCRRVALKAVAIEEKRNPNKEA